VKQRNLARLSTAKEAFMFRSNSAPVLPVTFDIQAAHSVASRGLKTTQRGQGMTEYIIIVALIAVAAIGVYKFFGQTVRSQTAGLAQELAGNNASAEIASANTAAVGAVAQKSAKTLGSYNGGN
jgi:type IV pilus assembly protein PilA